MSLASGSTPTTLTGQVGFVRSLTARGRALSWIGDGTLQRISLDDGSMSSTFIGDQQAATMDLENLYWGVDDHDKHGTVEKLALGATTPITLLAGPSQPGNEVTAGWMTGLLVDDQTVFAIDYYAQYSDGMHTTIRRAKK